MQIIFLKQARKELKRCPDELITDVLALIDDLAARILLKLPKTRLKVIQP